MKNTMLDCQYVGILNQTIKRMSDNVKLEKKINESLRKVATVNKSIHWETQFNSQLDTRQAGCRATAATRKPIPNFQFPGQQIKMQLKQHKK